MTPEQTQPMKFAVETLFTYGWENCWTDGDGRPELFDSREEAEQEIKDLIIACIDAVEGGYMEDSPDPSEFRVIEIPPAPTQHEAKERTTPMKTPNENGVYEPETREELARVGRSYATVKICQCDDGLFRYALDVTYSYGGFSGPITGHDEGFPSFKAAKDAGTEKLLKRFPRAWPSDPRSVHDELAAMRAQVEQHVYQPSLF